MRDRFRGCLLWGAVGDALGRAVEGWSQARIREQYGTDGIRHFVPAHGSGAGPTGTITDDTQLTMEVARSLLATDGRFSPDDFVARLIAWLPHGRGKGDATTRAVQALERGVRWRQISGVVDSAGNGAAMPAAPKQVNSRATWTAERDRAGQGIRLHLYNSAFALESVPAALFCFLRSPDNPRQVILTAVNAGYDADSVASMAGNLVGARCGAKRRRRETPEWWDDLEYRDDLIRLADGLADLALESR